MPRTLHTLNPTDIPDLHVTGQPDLWVTLAKASSHQQRFFKSTKALPIPGLGVLVQVSTQQMNPDGSHAVAEALAFVPGAVLRVQDGQPTLVSPETPLPAPAPEPTVKIAAPEIPAPEPVSEAKKGKR
jgi:hypothetical protein